MSGVVIVGAGPGLGRSIGLRFAREGVPVALLTRRQATADALAGEIGAYDVPTVAHAVDITDESALARVLGDVVDRLGIPDAVVYNAALIQPDAPGGLSARGHLDAWSVNVVGALSTAAQLLPLMAARGSGTFLITGGMPEPVAEYTSLSLGKAGVRTLVEILDQHFGPAGVHAATVTVFDDIAPGTAFDPDEIADHYWDLHQQPVGEWQLEVEHTGTDGPALSTEGAGRADS